MTRDVVGAERARAEHAHRLEQLAHRDRVGAALARRGALARRAPDHVREVRARAPLEHARVRRREVAEHAAEPRERDRAAEQVEVAAEAKPRALGERVGVRGRREPNERGRAELVARARARAARRRRRRRAVQVEDLRQRPVHERVVARAEPRHDARAVEVALRRGVDALAAALDRLARLAPPRPRPRVHRLGARARAGRQVGLVGVVRLARSCCGCGSTRRCSGGAGGCRAARRPSPRRSTPCCSAAPGAGGCAAARRPSPRRMPCCSAGVADRGAPAHEGVALEVVGAHREPPTLRPRHPGRRRRAADVSLS